MAKNKFNFEGEFSELSTQQLEFISSVLSDKGFQDAKVTINPLGQAGDNYIANVKRITAEKDGESIKMIIKVAPKIPQLRNAMNIRTVFMNEIVVYTEVFPKFTELEKAAGIPASERLRYAACYGFMIEDCEELILLEDLTDSDFTMLDRFKPLTDTDIRLILKSFARYHSLSYVLKYQEPDTYDNLKNKIVDFWKLVCTEEANDFSVMMETDVLSLFTENKYKDCIKGTVGKIYLLLKNVTGYDESSRFSVIQQGDSWTNNILFRVENGKSVSCCMIDYQLSRVNSPVADLLYMIFNCTDHEIRSQHYPDWIDYYHSELEKSLDEFGLKISYVYPRDRLDADLKRHAKLSTALAILLAGTLSREADAAKEFKALMEKGEEAQLLEKNKSSNMSQKSSSLYKSRIKGVIDTCLQFGLL